MRTLPALLCLALAALAFTPSAAATMTCPFGPTQPGTLLNVCYDLDGSSQGAQFGLDNGVCVDGTCYCAVGSVCPGFTQVPSPAVCAEVYVGGPIVSDPKVTTYCVPIPQLSTLECGSTDDDWPVNLGSAC